MEEDPLTRAVGHFGVWQLLIYIGTASTKFAEGWQQLSYAFLNGEMKYKCLDPPGDDGCAENCTKGVFDQSVFTSTISSEYGLVCTTDKISQGSWFQTVLVIGDLIGNFVFGLLSDRLGRKILLQLCVVGTVACGTACYFTSEYEAVLILRFLIGICIGGANCTSFVLLQEVVGPKWRELISVLYYLPFNTAHVTTALFAYFIRSWRKLQLALSVAGAIGLFSICFLTESPRLLIAKGKIAKAEKLIDIVVKVNRRPPVMREVWLHSRRRSAENIPNEPRIEKFYQIFKHKGLTRHAVALYLNFFSAGATFYGLAQYITTIGDVFINFAVGGLLGLFGCISFYFMAKYIGRKFTLLIAQLTVGICMFIGGIISVTLNPRDIVTETVFSAVGIGAITIAIPVLFMYCSEVFPTTIRSSAIGVGSALFKIGAAIAPLVVDMLLFSSPWATVFIFSFIAFTAALLILIVPETKGRPLPERLSDEG